MRKLTIQFHLILAALLCGIGPTACADFEQGLAAFDRGNYAQALREWETAYPAMDDADVARTAFSLGWLYQKGEGVTQIYTKGDGLASARGRKGQCRGSPYVGLNERHDPAQSRRG